MNDLGDLQFRLADMVRDTTDYDGMPVLIQHLSNNVGAPVGELAAALDLLARRGLIRIRKYLNGGGKFDYDPNRHNIHDIIAPPGFRVFRTPQGMDWVDTERRRRSAAPAIDIGDAAGNDAVKRCVAEVFQGREVADDRRRVVGLILGRLVWLGVQNYRDSAFLAKPARRDLASLREGTGRADFERSFYQPLLYAELAREPQLAMHLTKGSEQAGGTCDLCCVGDLPIEAKVIYPDGSSAEAESFGVGQTTQYAARSGIAFLAVLDLRARTTAAELGQIANDVRVVEVRQKDGPATVRIIRVQHVVGQGAPSRVS